MSRTGPTNIHKRKLVRRLKAISSKSDQAIWERVAELVSSPRRKRVEVNLSKINRYADENEVVVVPGKVLGAGKVEKKVTVLADSLTAKALEKLSSSGCRVILLEELASNSELIESLKGSRMRIIR